jgi:hypothetical protein
MQLRCIGRGFVANAGSGSGILLLAPENSAALWKEELKKQLFRFMHFKSCS